MVMRRVTLPWILIGQLLVGLILAASDWLRRRSYY